MRYAKIDKCECCNGKGIGVSLFVQGCSRNPHCPGCFNPESWDKEGGEPFTEETLLEIIQLIKEPYVQRFSLLGGEPLEAEKLEWAARVLMAVKAFRPDIKIWIYTGYTFQEIARAYAGQSDPQALKIAYIFNLADVLVDGPFIQELKDLTLPFRGSSNQRLIDLKKTFERKALTLLKV